MANAVAVERVKASRMFASRYFSIIINDLKTGIAHEMEIVDSALIRVHIQMNG